MNKELNELIEMLKADIENFQQCKLFALECGSSNAVITYYSNALIYIDSLIARINALIKEGSN